MEYVEPIRVELNLKGETPWSRSSYEHRKVVQAWCRKWIGKPGKLPTWRIDMNCVVFDNHSDAIRFKMGFE